MLALTNTASRYGLVAQLLHWLIVGLIVGQYTMAQIFESLPLGIEKIRWIVRHKEFGMLIFMLALIRLLWRLFNRPPALPQSVNVIQRRVAALIHALLYALIIFIPFSGWVVSSLANIPVDFFGWFDFPLIVAADKTAVTSAKWIHMMLARVLLVLAIVHILAALKHHWIDKDDVLKRMLPGIKSDVG